MKIYNNFMNDFVTILLYEFIQYTYPFWYNLFLVIIHLINLIIKKKIYIPVQTNLNLQKVLFIYNNTIIYYNIINLNFYNIILNLNNEQINIIGNDKYVIINYSFFKFNINNNKLITPYNDLLIQILPIKIYDQEDCGICFLNSGKLIGICGHQNICEECINKLNKCPVCNNKSMFRNINSNIINFIKSN